jgi:hypothetical protein
MDLKHDFERKQIFFAKFFIYICKNYVLKLQKKIFKENFFNFKVFFNNICHVQVKFKKAQFEIFFEILKYCLLLKRLKRFISENT